MHPISNIYVPNIRVGTYSCCFSYIQNIRCLYACIYVRVLLPVLSFHKPRAHNRMQHLATL